MDERVLSDAEVIKASRAFVCARLATYESAEEARFLATLLRGKVEDLRNTVFCFVAPDGKTALTRAGRSPGMALGDRDDSRGALLRAMARFAKRYPGNAAARTPPAIPYHADLRRGLNVASCDLRPLLVISASTPEGRAKLEAALRPLLWAEPLLGRYEVAGISDALDLALIEGAPGKDAVLVLAPNAYGTEGKLLGAETDATPAALRAFLSKTLERYRPAAKVPNALVRQALREGIQWKSAIPPTDGPGAQKTRRR